MNSYPSFDSIATPAWRTGYTTAEDSYLAGREAFLRDVLSTRTRSRTAREDELLAAPMRMNMSHRAHPADPPARLNGRPRSTPASDPRMDSALTDGPDGKSLNRPSQRKRCKRKRQKERKEADAKLIAQMGAIPDFLVEAFPCRCAESPIAAAAETAFASTHPFPGPKRALSLQLPPAPRRVCACRRDAPAVSTLPTASSGLPPLLARLSLASRTPSPLKRVAPAPAPTPVPSTSTGSDGWPKWQLATPPSSSTSLYVSSSPPPSTPGSASHHGSPPAGGQGACFKVEAQSPSRGGGLTASTSLLLRVAPPATPAPAKGQDATLGAKRKRRAGRVKGRGKGNPTAQAARRRPAFVVHRSVIVACAEAARERARLDRKEQMKARARAERDNQNPNRSMHAR